MWREEQTAVGQPSFDYVLEAGHPGDTYTIGTDEDQGRDGGTT